jgi:hypothetical protein
VLTTCKFAHTMSAMSQSSNKILLNPDATVTCPHCEREFALVDGFAKKAFDTVEQASERALAALREDERVKAERQAKKMAEERDAAHDREVAAVRAMTEETAARRSSGERRAYEQRIEEQAARLQSLQTEQLQLRAERQRLQDEKVAIALEVQRQVDARVAERDTIVRTQEQGRWQLKEAELHKTIDDMSAKLAEVQNKASQGSQQLQGEVLELALEDGLRRSFPLDAIEEVKKGQRGGDILQRVMTRTGQPAGIILWETKRAKDWSGQWTVKLKEDMRACGATIGILVTTFGALPRDWPGNALFATYEDCWVTQHSTAYGVAELLRAGLIELQRQRSVSVGKGEKMEALYDYLTSPQFALKLKAVYETFSRMKEELDSERNVTLQRWARREKQLQAGVTQLLGIGGEIQGLAQQELPSLELEPPPSGEDDR